MLPNEATPNTNICICDCVGTLKESSSISVAKAIAIPKFLFEHKQNRAQFASCYLVKMCNSCGYQWQKRFNSLRKIIGTINVFVCMSSVFSDK